MSRPRGGPRRRIRDSLVDGRGGAPQRREHDPEDADWRRQTEGKLSADDYGRAVLFFVTTPREDRLMLRANAATEWFKRSRYAAMQEARDLELLAALACRIALNVRPLKSGKTEVSLVLNPRPTEPPPMPRTHR